MPFENYTGGHVKLQHKSLVIISEMLQDRDAIATDEKYRK